MSLVGKGGQGTARTRRQSCRFSACLCEWRQLMQMSFKRGAFSLTALSMSHERAAPIAHRLLLIFQLPSHISLRLPRQVELLRRVGGPRIHSKLFHAQRRSKDLRGLNLYGLVHTDFFPQLRRSFPIWMLYPCRFFLTVRVLRYGRSLI